MRGPGQVRLRVACRRETLREADFRRPAVHVRQFREGQAFGGAGEFGRKFGLGLAQRFGLGRVFAVGVAPLHDEVLVRAVDAQAVPVAAAGQGADVGCVRRCECRREFDHDAAAVEFQVERVLGVEAAPVVRRRRVEHVLHGQRLERLVGDGGRRVLAGREREHQQGRQQREQAGFPRGCPRQA